MTDPTPEDLARAERLAGSHGRDIHSPNGVCPGESWYFDCRCGRRGRVQALAQVIAGLREENERLKATLEQRRSEAEDALRALTPGGSEFQTVEECIAFVRDERESKRRVIGTFKSERDALRGENERLRAEGGESLEIIGDLRRKLALAGVEGSPPPGGQGTIPALRQRARRLEEALRKVAIFHGHTTERKCSSQTCKTAREALLSEGQGGEYAEKA